MLFCSKLDLHQLEHVLFVGIWTNPSSTLLHLVIILGKYKVQ